MDEDKKSSADVIPSFNQVQLVAVKLELLDDEISQLYNSLDNYCNKVIQLGSDSIKELSKKGQTTEEFYQQYETVVKCIQDNIDEMKTLTKTQPVESEMTASSSSINQSSNQYFQVYTSIQTLREYKKLLEGLIQVFHNQMVKLGRSFISQSKHEFSSVSQTLEDSLVFVMKKRKEFGGKDNPDVFSRVPIHLPKSLPYVSKTSSSIGVLLERMNKLEERVESNKSNTDICSLILQRTLNDIGEMKEFHTTSYEDLSERTKDLEERIQTLDTHADITMVKSAMAIMDEDVEELKLRFESFLRAFAAIKTENLRNFVNFDRRMSDVETKGLSSDVQKSSEDSASVAPLHSERKLSAVEKSYVNVTERHPSVIKEKEKEADDVFVDGETNEKHV